MNANLYNIYNLYGCNTGIVSLLATVSSFPEVNEPHELARTESMTPPLWLKHGRECWRGCNVFAYAAVLVPAVLSVVTDWRFLTGRSALFHPPRLFPLVPVSACERQVLKDGLLAKVCLCVSVSEKQTRSTVHTFQKGSVWRIGNVTAGLPLILLSYTLLFLSHLLQPYPFIYHVPHKDFTEC